MNCKISCSFGEVVDKYTILKIKETKTNNKEKLKNIQNEIEAICFGVPEVNNNDKLFGILFLTNLNLWNYEDYIRKKSKNNQFDASYILCAESIHKENDKRYLIKKTINEKYNSKLKEEKIYEESLDKYPYYKLNKGKQLYEEGKYNESLKIIEEIMLKYENYSEYNNFYIDLLFSYSNICAIFNKLFPYLDKIKYIMSNLSNLDITTELKFFSLSQFAQICLKNKLYEESYDYLNCINYISGPNVCFNDMSFFGNTDKNETLLLYEGGGLGDNIMFSRFLPILSNKYKNNKINFVINNRLLWLFEIIFSNLSNVLFFPYNKLDIIHDINKFNYHCNTISLIKNLK